MSADWTVSQERRHALVDSMNFPGDWRFTLNSYGEEITVHKDNVQNSRRPGALRGFFSSYVRLDPKDDEATIIGKAFAVVQFLADHRRTGSCSIHSHDSPKPPDTDACRRFYIENRGALLGRAAGSFRVPAGLHGAKS